MSIRVLLADDEPLVRAGLRMILESETDIEVVGDAEDGGQAAAAVARLRPDLVLMDIQMPVVDGLEATRRIVADSGPATRVVILTTFQRDEYVFEALRSGASGFLLKNTPADELVRAVRVVARGDALLSPAVTRRLIESFTRAPATPRPAAELAGLTDSERTMLRLLAAGRSDSDLAADLQVSPTMVRIQVRQLLTKLGLHDRVQAVVLAYESGLVTPGTG
ncbi:MAG: response regulator [Mycobacteriales bacterium]